MATCDHCGADLKDGARFCHSCGATLRQEQERKLTETATRQPGGTAVAYCVGCGASLRDGARFCQRCGEKQPEAPLGTAPEDFYSELKRFTPAGLLAAPTRPDIHERQHTPLHAMGEIRVDSQPETTPGQQSQSQTSPEPKHKRIKAYVVGAAAALVCITTVALIIFFLFGNNSSKGIPRSIKEFTGNGAESVKKTKSESYAFGKQSSYYGTWDGDRVSFDVDDKTGEVRGLFRYGQQGRSVSVSEQQAEKTALEFAQEHYADFSKLEMKKVNGQLVDNGADTNEFYEFDWQKYDTATGVALPNTVEITVNAETGKVDSYSSFRADVTVSTKPKVSKDEAARSAVSAARDVQGAKVKGEPVCGITTLPVGKPGGKQALLWIVEVEASDQEADIPGAAVYVNAETGKVEKVDLYL